MKSFLNFFEFSFVLATQTNSKSGEDVSPTIDPEWFVEKSSVLKDHKLVYDGKYPICIKCPSFLTFAYPLQNKFSSTAKNYALFVIVEQSDWSRKISLAISNGNRTEWSPIWSVIIRVINKIGRLRSGSPICLITSMITDRIGRHKVLLPINHNFNKICDILGSFF